jgi:hypothetical protein
MQPVRTSLLVGIAAIAGASAAAGQQSEARVCAKVLAVLPTKTDLLYEALAADTRERFELRECGTLDVYGYEHGKTLPSLRFQTGEHYPPYLFHFQNVLAFQALGGASDHVYVFTFDRGKPRLVHRMATKDVLSASIDPARRTVTILIPPTTYPDGGKWPPTPTPKKLVLPLQ